MTKLLNLDRKNLNRFLFSDWKSLRKREARERKRVRERSKREKERSKREKERSKRVRERSKRVRERSKRVLASFVRGRSLTVLTS